jgi:outer membrane protein TolC
MPKIYIQGGYKYSDNVYNLSPEGGFTVQAGVDFNLDWGKPFKEVKARKHLTYKLQNIKRNTELKILMQVKRAYENYQAAKSNYNVAKSSFEEAKEFFRITKLKYSNGLASNTDVLDAETMLTNAKSNEKKAYYEILKAYFEIENAIGCKIGENL